jgi:hypothetical protein
MSGSTTVPIVLGPAGMVPASPADIQTTLLAAVAATNPGYTANLPGTLIEDISSTDVASIMQCNSALVELVNSVTPYGANQFLLNQLGQIYGVQQGQATNATVDVVFSGSAGYVIPVGFYVSDGTYQYIVQDGGVISTGGTSPSLRCVATQSGSWAIPANTVTTIATSVPSGYTLTVNNPTAGTPSSGAQTVENYRSQVLQAGLAASMGMPRYLKTLLGNVEGVENRLVSVIQVGTTWEIIVGGNGDLYQIAYAIFSSIFDTSTLAGSQTGTISGISNASAAVVTTLLPHGLTTGNSVTISGVLGMIGANGTWTITVLSTTTFSISYNSTSAPTYGGGGVLASNTRTRYITITDYPNTYLVPFVVPIVQNVTIGLVWNTTSTNSVSSATMASLGSNALAAYINSIPVGAPINLFELQNAFQIATASVLPTQLLTRMIFTVTINGVSAAPLTISSIGTGTVTTIYTPLPHGLSGSITIAISGATGTALINGMWTPTVLTPYSFTIPYNSTGLTYTANSGSMSQTTGGIIPGDPEGYFSTSTTNITITQG